MRSTRPGLLLLLCTVLAVTVTSVPFRPHNRGHTHHTRYKHSYGSLVRKPPTAADIPGMSSQFDVESYLGKGEAYVFQVKYKGSGDSLIKAGLLTPGKSYALRREFAGSTDKMHQVAIDHNAAQFTALQTVSGPGSEFITKYLWVGPSSPDASFTFNEARVVYTVMEIVGDTDMIRFQETRPPLGEVNSLIAQVIKGVIALQKAGIEHHDLHGGNVRLDTQTKQIYIIDYDKSYFGVSDADFDTTTKINGVTGAVAGHKDRMHIVDMWLHSITGTDVPDSIIKAQYADATTAKDSWFTDALNFFLREAPTGRVNLCKFPLLFMDTYNLIWQFSHSLPLADTLGELTKLAAHTPLISDAGNTVGVVALDTIKGLVKSNSRFMTVHNSVISYVHVKKPNGRDPKMCTKKQKIINIAKDTTFALDGSAVKILEEGRTYRFVPKFPEAETATKWVGNLNKQLAWLKAPNPTVAKDIANKPAIDQLRTERENEIHIKLAAAFDAATATVPYDSLNGEDESRGGYDDYDRDADDNW